MELEYSLDTARKIGDRLGIDWRQYSLEEFRMGLAVETEHGSDNPKTDVTHDDLLITGRIALAHLNELPDYYTRLKAMESAVVSESKKAHYYGDLTRRLFLTAALIMLIGLPFVKKIFSLPLFVGLAAIMGLGFFAGLSSPTKLWATEINTGVSAIAFVVFEYYAVRSYQLDLSVLFVINQFLAVIFLFAIYYNTKTWRGVTKA